MDITRIEKLIGYSFKAPALLERALTHRSWAYEKHGANSDAAVNAADNESLEFLGDSVLGLAVADHLFAKNPEMKEGDLTVMKHHIVSAVRLTAAAERLEIGNFLRVGRGEEKTGGRRKAAVLADTVEAVLGAIFLDGGYFAAKAAVGRIFAEDFRTVTPRSSVDYKSLLQETLQADKLSAPVYKLLRSEGQPHERQYFVEVKWNSGSAAGTGTSIKAAEMMAASEALRKIKERNPKKQ
ncbi:MAG: ribonuclease III [Blastocatellia bacterium]|nr:ribonuclease III [Blastocatellia bacterium]